MYSENLKSKNVHQQALLFAPNDTREHFLWIKTVLPEELASFFFLGVLDLPAFSSL